VTVTGRVGLGALAPTGTVDVTLGGVTQAAAIAPEGTFSATFATGALAAGNHVVGYGYGGDGNFTPAAATSTLTVGYAVGVMFDDTRAYNSGSTVVIRLDTLGAGGADVSSAALAVRAISVTGPGGAVYNPVGPGSTYQDGLFSYKNGEYVFNLKTAKAMAAGVYTLWVQVGTDPTLHAVTLILR
jgi:hypothetical protein